MPAGSHRHLLDSILPIFKISPEISLVFDVEKFVLATSSPHLGAAAIFTGRSAAFLFRVADRAPTIVSVHLDSGTAVHMEGTHTKYVPIHAAIVRQILSLIHI